MIDGPVIQAASGEYVTPLTPWAFEPRIGDIAHALSHLCRFTGHCEPLYTVAEHSCRVADLCPPDERLAGLLHDASEAYLGDVASPLKHHPFFGEAYRDAERSLQRRIFEWFGLDENMPASVHHADLVLLATEKRDLMPSGPDWSMLNGVEPLKTRITPWGPRVARYQFLDRYRSLLRVAQAA